MAILSIVAKMQKAQAKAKVAEKLDYKPLAIIAPTNKKPETLSEAVARVLGHSLEQEEWERIRGVEYDTLDTDDRDFDENFGDDTENMDAGHFYQRKVTEKEKSAGVTNAAEFKTPETKDTQSTGENAPRNENGVGGNE